MTSLLFGLIAALAWGLHDFLVREVSQRAGAAPLLFTALIAGSIMLVPLTFGSTNHISPQGLALALASGAGFTLASVGLYRAFAIGPVRLVAPICGAYPVGTLALASLQGKLVNPAEWIAVLAVIAGIALVARAPDDTPTNQRGSAMLWATAGAIGFALTFHFGQMSAREIGDLPATLIARLTAAAFVGAYLFFTRTPLAPARPHLKILCLMGALDVTALGLVIAAGGTANPEYAAVSSSIFGSVTILLAWRLLSEPMRPLQWFGVAVVFASIASLAAA